MAARALQTHFGPDGRDHNANKVHDHCELRLPFLLIGGLVAEVFDSPSEHERREHENERGPEHGPADGRNERQVGELPCKCGDHAEEDECSLIEEGCGAFLLRDFEQVESAVSCSNE